MNCSFPAVGAAGRCCVDPSVAVCVSLCGLLSGRCQVEMPRYTTVAICKERILTAIAETESSGFQMM